MTYPNLYHSAALSPIACCIFITFHFFTLCSVFMMMIMMMMMMMNCFCGMVDKRKSFNLFPPGIIVRDPHHRESPTLSEKNFNLYIT